MQINVSMVFDLDTARGRALFEQLQRRLVPDPPETHEAADTAAASAPDLAKTNRQQAAATARAAKATKQQAAAAEPVEPPVDVLGPNGQDQDDEDLGLTEPASSPGEAKDQALALVREIYAAGKVAEVKTLQKEWKVAKFYDVPVEKGHEFYQRVMKVAQSVGLRA